MKSIHLLSIFRIKGTKTKNVTKNATEIKTKQTNKNCPWGKCDL